MAANVKWSSPQYSDLTYGSGSYGSPIQWRDGRVDVRIIVFNAHFPGFPDGFPNGVNYPVADWFSFGVTGTDVLAHKLQFHSLPEIISQTVSESVSARD